MRQKIGLRSLLSILCLVLHAEVFSQIELSRPSSALIERYQNMGDVASVLIDSTISFSSTSRITIKVEGAKALNLYFNKFKIDPTCSLKVFNAQKEFVIEYNQESNADSGLFVIPPVEGEEVSLELFGTILKEPKVLDFVKLILIVPKETHGKKKKKGLFVCY